MVPHLLVTNDFPPKVGGIQSYLWELWRRLPAGSFTVLTTPYSGAEQWDAAQPFRIVRDPSRLLLPTRALARRIEALASTTGAELVVFDPALPVGLLGPRLDRPYGVVIHGAEVTVPARTPGAARLVRRVLRGAALVVAAGGYPAREAERAARATLPITVVPPGVDTSRFRPIDPLQRRDLRRRYGLDPEAPVIVSVSRLVPRKGFDTLIRAAARLRHRFPRLVVAIAGEGRDRGRLERLARRGAAPVVFLGRVPDHDLPGLYAAADVFAMLCRNRWAGLEQEGFGIVFLEAAAAGVPEVAGDSGGAGEAVVDGETGLVIADPGDVEAATSALERLLGNPDLRRAMGSAGRIRAEAEYSYDALAKRLSEALDTIPPATR